MSSLARRRTRRVASVENLETRRLLAGVNQVIEAESFSQQTGMQNYGHNLGNIDPGDFAVYPGVDLTGATLATFQYSSPNSNFHLEIHIDALAGTKIADVVETATGTGFDAPYVGLTTPLSQQVTGAHDIYVTFSGQGPGFGVCNLDFIEFTAGNAITGRTFGDTNSNGIYETAETPLADVVVYLDADNNNALDVGETSLTTDAAGNYTFADLTDGDYIVRQVTPTGYRRSLPNPPVNFYTVTAGGSANKTGNYFGDTTNILLTGKVWNDLNGDGVMDAGEDGIINWTVYVDLNLDGKFQDEEPGRVTDASGSFQFKGLAAGSGTLRVLPFPGWMPTNPDTGSYTGSASSGQMIPNLTFGVRRIPQPIAPALAADSSILKGDYDGLELLSE